MLSTNNLLPLLTFILALIASHAIAADDIDITYDKFTLDNGLTVIVHEDRKAPVVAVAVWYKVGSKDEPTGKTGFAHLFEHLMFNGSENYDDDWFKPLQEVGATGLNGTTDTDRTNYFQTVPTPALDRILWMESDRMGHFLGAVTQDKLDEQRKVVQNEKRQGENQPYGRVFTHVFKGLFPTGHPYNHSVIGSMEDLNAASLEDVHEWFNTYYGPSNAILVLAGDINKAEAKPLVEKYFAHIAPGPPLTKWESWSLERAQNTREVMYDQVPQARIYRVWASPADIDPASTELYIAANALGGGKNSRLYKELVYDKQIATSADVFNYELQMASIFGIVVDVKPGQSVADVEARIDAITGQFLERGPTKEEVSLVATKTRASIIRGLEEVGGFGGKAVTLAQGELIAGDPSYLKTELKELAAATPRSVANTARQWLSAGYHQITVLPYPDYEAQAPAVNRQDGLPAITAETQLRFPDIAETTLSNGMRVYVAERDTIPVVNVSLQFDAGYAADAGASLGLANFTAAMLDEGAGQRDSLALAKDLERLGAAISVGSDLDMTAISLSSLKENLSTSLDILRDVVRAPRFDPAEIERQRSLILTGIEQEKSQPVSIALRLLPPLLYGDDHAYGIPFTGSGTQQAVSAITREDLTRFTQQWLRPDNGAIFVVGDTSLEEIRPLLEKRFGDWQASGPVPQKNIATAALPNAARILIVDRPGSEQSMILGGHLAPPTSAPNNIAINAMNEIIGGNFNARINMNLREGKGWAYGAYTFLQSARGQRPFMVYAPVQTDKTAPSLAELRRELKEYISQKPATAAELERVKLDQIRSLPGAFETAGAVLGALETNARFNRPLNYHTSLPERYRALTTNDITQTAKEVLHPDALTWLIIGDAAKIKTEIEALNIGPVEVIDMNDL